MSFEIGITASFAARHHLRGDFGPSREPHEHAYRVEVSVSGGALRADGTLFDITLLQQALATVLAELEGQDLNQIAALAEPNPTAEVVARHLFQRVAPALARASLDRLTVQVWESPAAYATYSDSLA